MDTIHMDLKRFKPTISITHYNRPEYSDQCLYYLSKCHNIDKYKIHNSIDLYDEKTSNDIVEVCKKYDLRQTFKVYEERVGLLDNIYYGYKYCFENLYSKFCIHSDDDNIFGRDALYFYEYYLKRFRHTQFVFPGAYTHYPISHDINDIDKVELRPLHISEPAIGMTLDNFNKIKKMRGFRGPANLSPGTLLMNKFREDNITEFYTLAPLVSRANNIGREGGTFVLSAEHFDELGQHLPVWVESFDQKPVRNFIL